MTLGFKNGRGAGIAAAVVLSVSLFLFPRNLAAAVAVGMPMKIGPLQAPLVAGSLDQGLYCVGTFQGPGVTISPNTLLSNLVRLEPAELPDLRLPEVEMAALYVAVDALSADEPRAQAIQERLELESESWGEVGKALGRIRKAHGSKEARKENGGNKLFEAAFELRRNLEEAKSPYASPEGMDRLFDKLFDTGPTDHRGLVRRLRRPLERNTFTRYRGLDEYGLLLGREFMDDVRSLGPEDHLILPGGEGVVAKDYYHPGSIKEGEITKTIERSRGGLKAQSRAEKDVVQFVADMDEASRRPKKEKASITNIAYGSDRDLAGRVERKHHGGRFRRIVGQLLEYIPNYAMLPKARKSRAKTEAGRKRAEEKAKKKKRVHVADVNDALLYTPFPSKVLAKYMSLIGTDGVLHLFLGHPGSNNGLLKDRVILPSGEEIPFVKWLESIEGLSIKKVRTEAFAVTSLSFAIRRSGRVSIPHLKLTDIRKTKDQANQADKVRVFTVMVSLN